MNQTDTMRQRWDAVMMNNYGTPPVALASGDGAVVTDVDGRTYLDLLGGIAVNVLGHRHPAIIEAVTQQMSTLGHTSNLYASEPGVALAEELVALLATDAQARVFFCNSGTEANEVAFKLSRLTGRTKTFYAREAILVLNGDLRVSSANQAFYRDFGVTRPETENRALYELGDGQWNSPKLRELLENVLPNDGRVEDFAVRHKFPSLGERVMVLNARRIEPQAGQPLILLYIEDVTDKKI